MEEKNTSSNIVDSEREEKKNFPLATGEEKLATQHANKAEPKVVEFPSLSSPSLVKMVKDFFSGFFKIRDEPTSIGRFVMAVLSISFVFVAWTVVTRGSPEQRIIPPTVLGSPKEVFGTFGSLWYERALMRNLFASLDRVIKGFGLALIVGVPIGVLCGTFRRIDAFFAPIMIFGRNIPIVTLVPLSLFWFGGIGEAQKVGFIFIASVAFVVFDAAQAVASIDRDYLDTAYTLGATRKQVIQKVLVPLAMPDIFNSMRLLFGLAFGYIILAEVIGAEYGIGKLIQVSERRGPREHVYLILFFITLSAYFIDRILFTLQKFLFPYRYGR